MAARERQVRGDAKREAIIDAARRAFARDGFAGASIDAIALEAGASTRTIYNHFGDKQQLFTAIVVESAERVRQVQLEEIGRHIGKIEDLRSDLCALGVALNSVRQTFPDHFGLIRQIHADAVSLPADVFRSWREAGPRAVQIGLAGALARLADRGLLAVPNPDRAARQFLALVGAEISDRVLAGETISAKEVEAIVADGVSTFLAAFSPSVPNRPADLTPVQPSQ